MRTLLTGLLVLSFTACGGAKSDPKSGGPNGVGATQTVSEFPLHCGKTGFDLVGQHAKQDGNLFDVRTYTTGTSNIDQIQIQSFQNDAYNGPTEPGTYSLEGTNYADCGLCVLARSGCDGDSCDKLFYADVGEVVIEQMGENGTEFVAHLAGVEFKEVTLNAQTFVTTPVENGTTWCPGDIEFGIEIGAPAQDQCVPVGTGRNIGDNISNYALQNCYEERLSLHSRCGQSKLLHMVATAGWCPACAQWVPQVEQMRTAEAENGYDVMYLLGEDAQYNQPTFDYCFRYADRHNVDPANVYIDTSGGWNKTFANLNDYSSNGAFGLPWNAVLRGSNMEYMYVDMPDMATRQELMTTIDDLLAQ